MLTTSYFFYNTYIYSIYIYIYIYMQDLVLNNVQGYGSIPGIMGTG